MAEITAALVKDLREKTGAGMMDCKKALTETQGNLEEAVDWLRKKGLAAAAKKSGRVAAEGLIGVASVPAKAAMVEVNAETDFVSRNDLFQGAARQIAGAALGTDGSVDAITAAKLAGGETVQDHLTNLIATIGENMMVRRAAKWSVENGVVASYIHTNKKVGVLVEVPVMLTVVAIVNRSKGWYERGLTSKSEIR